MTNSEKAKIFKAFCDERRIEILALLSNGEKCACRLLEEVDISQATLSHHMKILCDSGVVISRKEGKWTHYSIDKMGIEVSKKILEELTESQCSSDTTDYCKNK